MTHFMSCFGHGEHKHTHTQVPYEVEVLEDAALGTTVFQGIRVEDRDTVGDNLNVSCSVSPTATDVDACSK